MKFYKFVGRSIGLTLMTLAFMWSPDPESGALMLFFGSVLIFLGVAKTER